MQAGHAAITLHLRETGAEVGIRRHDPEHGRYQEGCSHAENLASVQFEGRHRCLLLPGDSELRRYGRPRLLVEHEALADTGGVSPGGLEQFRLSSKWCIGHSSGTVPMTPSRS